MIIDIVLDNCFKKIKVRIVLIYKVAKFYSDNTKRIIQGTCSKCDSFASVVVLYTNMPYPIKELAISLNRFLLGTFV